MHIDGHYDPDADIAWLRFEGRRAVPPVPLSDADDVRDPLANPAAVHAARQRPMAERLALALSWNRLASQLRSGLAEATRRPTTRQ